MKYTYAVPGEEGEPVAVLLRALEPVEGLETMRAHRARRSAGRGVVEGERPPSSGGRPMRDRDLCSGPGKLCQALAIDRSFSGGDLAANGALFIEAGRADFTPLAAEQLVNTPRIGVDYAGAEWSSAMLRWYLRESPHVSVR